jgi:hypothetical protein
MTKVLSQMSGDMFFALLLVSHSIMTKAVPLALDALWAVPQFISLKQCPPPL